MDDFAPALKRYTKTLAGRITGICWDVAISVLTLLAIPASLLYGSYSLLTLGPVFLLLSVLMIFVAIFSAVFGVFWTFRGHLK